MTTMAAAFFCESQFTYVVCPFPVNPALFAVLIFQSNNHVTPI